MPYANNNGTRIHYHVEGDGPPLVLQHGFTSCIATWYEYGYVDPLKNDFRLIAIDARGHGASDKPHDPEAYDLETRVGDVISVLDDLDIDQAHYLGYSMGGVIGFGIAKYALARFHSLTIGGMNPYGSGRESPEARIELLQKGMEAFVAQSEANSGPIDTVRREWLLANDPQALIASLRAPLGFDGMDKVLPNINVPCLLYAGGADSFFPGVKECVPHIPNAKFVPFPGLDHGQTSRAGDLVVPHLTKFLKELAAQASPR